MVFTLPVPEISYVLRSPVCRRLFSDIHPVILMMQPFQTDCLKMKDPFIKIKTHPCIYAKNSVNDKQDRKIYDKTNGQGN